MYDADRYGEIMSGREEEEITAEEAFTFAPIRELDERVRIPSVRIPRSHGMSSHAVREER